MKTLFTLLLFSILPFCISAQDINPLYSLPKVSLEKKVSASDENKSILGTDSGLYRVVNDKTLVPLWNDGKVHQILRITNDKEDSWYFNTSKGILFSKNLKDFEYRNNGLPFLVIKKYDGVDIKLVSEPQEIKDISYNPLNSLELVVATKDTVFRTKNGGINWERVGRVSQTSGIKAVAIMYEPSESSELNTIILVSHTVLGVSYIYPDSAKPVWKDECKGFASTDQKSSADEVSDIFPVLFKREDGTIYTELFMTQTFLPRLYRFDFKTKTALCIYKGDENCSTFDGLTLYNSSLLFLTPGDIKTFNVSLSEISSETKLFKDWKNEISLSLSKVNAAWISPSKSGDTNGLLLNEAWLLNSGSSFSPYNQKIDGKKSLYVPCYQAHLPGGIQKFKKIILDNKLNSLVIDMKDDYGLLRYDSQDELVTQKGVVSKYALNLENFVEEFKKDNIYLIARIVVFKDRNLSTYNNGVYAIKDKKTGRAWAGIKDYETNEDGSTKANYYDESWVDPYCQEVWEYNVAVAKELILRGFDEVQFDYIRFPTDEKNLNNTQFSWRSKGMDKESALISFLSYARENIDAPIGIDIYGANGWYRSGTRTGQDVELLSEFVDVICPMFYPSHFEHGFLNYSPNEERPYRIYYYGTYRNTVMARNKIVVRPWIQAFFLNVPYDRQYYDSEYVRREVFGVRDSIDRGYMFWNNGGNYSKISPDVGNEKYNGTELKANEEFKKKTPNVMINKKDSPVSSEGVMVLDSVLNQNKRETVYDRNPLLNIFEKWQRVGDVYVE